jgi:hypothetical protein
VGRLVRLRDKAAARDWLEKSLSILIATGMPSDMIGEASDQIGWGLRSLTDVARWVCAVCFIFAQRRFKRRLADSRRGKTHCDQAVIAVNLVVANSLIPVGAR